MDFSKYVKCKIIAVILVGMGLFAGAAAHISKSEPASILSFGLLLSGIYMAFKTAEKQRDV